VLLADAVKARTAKIVTDALRPYEFDREKAVDFGPVTSSSKLGEITLRVDSDGVFQPRLYTAPANGGADVSLALDGKTLPIIARPAPNALQLGSLFLTKGAHKASLTRLGGFEGVSLRNWLKISTSLSQVFTTPTDRWESSEP